MLRMRLKLDHFGVAYCLTDEEADRLAEAHDSGERLVFRDGGGMLVLEGGVLTITGFEKPPRIFSTETPFGMAPQPDSEAVCRFKEKITKVVIGEGTKILSDGIFRNCPNLEELVIADSVTYIVSPCTESMKLKPYPLPSSIRKISYAIYPNCPDRVVLPEGLESMWQVFRGTKIKSVYIPGTLKNISLFAFRDCHELCEVIISDGVEKIENSAFSHCTSLQSVKIPASVKRIEGCAFAGCTSLAEVELPEGCVVFDDAFYNTPYFRRINEGRVETLPQIPFEGDESKIADLATARERLSGKSLTEQAKHLKVHIKSCTSSYSYGELDSESKSDFYIPLSEDTDVKKLIMLDGIIVGILIDGEKILLGEDKCTYFASEDDGTGQRCVDEERGFFLAE